MSTQFLSKLSQNYIELLEDNEYYDITIEVGKDPNVKIFRSHKSILCYRSPYLRRTLASNNNQNKDNVLINIKFPNISPEVFQIILRYIYGGILSLNVQDPSEIFQILLAADDLFLQELVDYLQKYLIENKSEWMEQHFEFIHRTSFQYNSLLEIQQFCTDLMAKSPEKVFKSLDFTSLPKKSLVQLIKRDDLQMKEIEVWEHVLKWGLAQNPTLLPDPNDCGSRDGFTSKKFHELCDGKPNTITLIKVKGAEEIIGGYNPLKWESSGGYGSFIFSFKNKDIKNAIISNMGETNQDYTEMVYKKCHYEKRIRDTDGEFIIEEYEIFQILKR
ncbi:uncharacterized protein OCT59_025363 [Rhizophagus irregularis]|uniref:uncharacterized protein n=1 Tax=Rhizophagus irregularis TaxID=588596 RepID=UPI003333B706|nr:hypothetical protein OCT59_025363 [Rhizophagus irregularis]